MLLEPDVEVNAMCVRSVRTILCSGSRRRRAAEVQFFSKHLAVQGALIGLKAFELIRRQAR